VARRRHHESAGRYAGRQIRNFLLQLVVAAIFLVFFITVIGPLAANLLVASFQHAMLNATTSPVH
jgi:hypothetical protein